MEFQLMRPKTLLVNLEKDLKRKQMKTRTPSCRVVSFSSNVASSFSSSTTSSFSFSSSSSCPDYCQSEVFVNIDRMVAEMMTEYIASKALLPAALYHTQSPSIEDGDHRDHQGIIDIPAAASSERLTAFQKSELSKVMLPFLVTVIVALFIYMKSYSDDKSTIPQWLIIFVPCILFFGVTFIIIGIVLREMIPLIARVLEVVGFLLILLGVFGLGSSILSMVLIWVAAGLCYISITIALLLDLFPKLAGCIRPTYTFACSMLVWLGKIYKRA